MADQKDIDRKTSRRSIGNLDGTSYGMGGTNTVRVQAGTGDFYGPKANLNDDGYQKGISGDPLSKLNMQNVGAGSGLSFARRERDGFTYSFRTILAGDGMQIQTVGDTIVLKSFGGADRFTVLNDTPHDYVGDDGKVLMVDEENSRIVFVDPPYGASDFLSLTDTPDTYAGMDGLVVTVDETNNRLVFSTAPPPPDPILSFLALSDTPNTYNSANGKFLSVDEFTGTIQFTDINMNVPNRITFAENPPNNALQGDGWWDTNDGAFYLYYTDGDTNQWVESGSYAPIANVQTVFAYDYGSFFSGQPGPEEVIYRWRAPRSHTLADNFVGCLFTCGVTPSANFVTTVYLNGQVIGTWTLQPSGVAVLTTIGNGIVNVPANVELKIVAPMQTDGTIADLVISFKGERI